MTVVLDRSPTRAPVPDGALLRAFGEAAERRFGLWRTSRQLPSLERRLAQTLRACELDAGEGWALVRALESAPDDAPWVLRAADVVPNQSTSFFRDAVQLEALFAALAARRPQQLHLLSAGCATGEEVYTLAMLALESLVHTQGTHVAVTGLDLSAGALARAHRARYSPEAVARAQAGGPEGWVDRWMRRDGGQLELRGAPRQMASFVRRNLAVPGALEGLGPFDAIVCRNVLLYFAPSRARQVVESLVARLVPGGLLILGPAEVLPEELPAGTERLMLGSWSALRMLEGGA